MKKYLGEIWVSSKECSQYLVLNKDYLPTWINNGKIPCYRLGKIMKNKANMINEAIKIDEKAKND